MSDYIGGLKQVCNNLAIDMVKWAKANHPWKNQSGTLERSIGPIAATTTGNVTSFGVGEGGDNADYAKYIEARKDKAVLQPTIEFILPSAKKDIADYTAAFIAQEAQEK
jgi:hypothetical protein